MTPKEYWKRMCDAAAETDYTEKTGKADKVIKDYVKFAIDEIQKSCDGNVSRRTMWMWVYALRKIADVFDSHITSYEKELMKLFDECAGIHIAIDAMPYSEGDGNAEE